LIGALRGFVNFVDLHVHTTCSDGTVCPSDVVKLAKAKGLKAIAVTDHDTVDGIADALAEGEKSNIEVIPGADHYKFITTNLFHCIAIVPLLPEGPYLI